LTKRKIDVFEVNETFREFFIRNVTECFPKSAHRFLSSDWEALILQRLSPLLFQCSGSIGPSLVKIQNTVQVLKILDQIDGLALDLSCPETEEDGGNTRKQGYLKKMKKNNARIQANEQLISQLVKLDPCDIPRSSRELVKVISATLKTLSSYLQVCFIARLLALLTECS
jgi:hypothetical protein